MSESDINVQGVTPDYYRVLQPQLVAGRLPTDDELARKAPVIVVSQRLAQAYWPTVSAVGRPLIEAGSPVPYTVVGVVKDVRWHSWDIETASIYGPYSLLSRRRSVTFLVMGRGRTGPVAAEVLHILESPDLLVKPFRASVDIQNRQLIDS